MDGRKGGQGRGAEGRGVGRKKGLERIAASQRQCECEISCREVSAYHGLIRGSGWIGMERI